MRLSIRSVLIAAIVGLVTLTVAIILLGTLVSNENALVDQIQATLGRDADRAAARTAAFLEPTAYTSTLTAALLSENPDWASAITSGPLIGHFNAVLDARPEASGIFFGSSEGDFVFVSRDESRSVGGRRIKQVANRGSRTTTLTWIDANGLVEEVEADPNDTYDPRIRPWYLTAERVRSQTWTDPYVFFSSQQPGVTSSAPVVLTDGTYLGAVGIDIEISSLSMFLEELDFTENGSAYLIDSDLHVLAHSDGEVATNHGEDGFDLTYLNELDDQVALAAFEKLNQTASPLRLSEPASVSVESNGEQIEAIFVPVGAADWVVAVQVPRSDYLGDLRRNQQFHLVMAMAIGTLAALIGYALAEGVARPIRQLRSAATAIQENRPRSQPVTSRFAEIDDTARAIWDAHTLLEERVAARTDELNQEVVERREAELRALAASKSKSEFLASVSHELRTPLTAIIGYAGIIKSMIDDLSKAEIDEQVGVISDAGNHLLELINDILDLAKIEAGEMPLTEGDVDLGTLAEAVEKLMGPRARGRGLALSVTAAGPTMVRADERRMKQIMLNLVSNAIKYTPPGGSVELRVDRDPRGIVLEVIDTGIGMDAEEVKVALSMFGQIPNDLATKDDGTGLGLALTQSLVENHGGALEIESEKGVGTTVRVVLPHDRILGVPIPG